MKYTNIGLLLSILLTFIISDYANASERQVQKFEGELHAGLTIPIESYHGGTHQISAGFGFEGRYNFSSKPFDCGIMLDLTTARHGYEKLYNDGYDRWQNNRTLSFAITGAYNFAQASKFNPYVGVAIGVTHNDVVGDRYFPSNGTYILFAPRVGIEVAYHFRVYGQCNISRKGYNNFALSFGFVLGGKPKNKQ